MNKLLFYILLTYCCSAWSVSKATSVDSSSDISNIIGKIEQAKYSTPEQAKTLALESLKITQSYDNIKPQIQLYKILGELEIELANYEAAITYFSTGLSLSEGINKQSLMIDMLNALTN